MVAVVSIGGDEAENRRSFPLVERSEVLCGRTSSKRGSMLRQVRGTGITDAGAGSGSSDSGRNRGDGSAYSACLPGTQVKADTILLEMEQFAGRATGGD